MNQPAFPSPAILAAVDAALAEAGGSSLHIRSLVPAGGGAMSRNFRLETGLRPLFLKLAPAAGDRFAAEADGLAALARCPALVVPRVLAQGEAGFHAFLVMDWLDLRPGGDDARLGEAVAALHGIVFPRFGWRRDNYIGTTPQANGWDRDWAHFFAERRLKPMVARAAARGAPDLGQRAAPLLAALPRLLGERQLLPGLVHGDLWHGNRGFVGGRPALFDPAVYAGDGESDLAMAELFGGFSPRFFAAYRQLRPLDEGYPRRRSIYQLYHVLNHHHLFGGGYARQAGELIDGVLAAL